jgi:hypothetical protein
MFLPQQKERRSPKLLHQNGCFSFGIKGKHSDCRAVIFDLPLDELSIGQANGNNRETSPPLVLGLDTYDFAFHVEHRQTAFLHARNAKTGHSSETAR